MDPLFWKRLRKLLHIVIPRLKSREAGMLILHSAFLVFRTVLSLYVADLDGRYVRLCRMTRQADSVRIVSSLVLAQPVTFMFNLVKWLLVAIPATYTNSMLEFLQSKLALAYRTRFVASSLCPAALT